MYKTTYKIMYSARVTRYVRLQCSEKTDDDRFEITEMQFSDYSCEPATGDSCLFILFNHAHDDTIDLVTSKLTDVSAGIVHRPIALSCSNAPQKKCKRISRNLGKASLEKPTSPRLCSSSAIYLHLFSVTPPPLSLFPLKHFRSPVFLDFRDSAEFRANNQNSP